VKRRPAPELCDRNQRASQLRAARLEIA
jgi:hypothetical protein